MYYIKSNLNHNGVSYAKGDKIDLDAETAKSLVADGVVSSKYVASEAEEAAPEVIDGGDVESEGADKVEEEDAEPVPGEDALIDPNKPQAYLVTEEDLVNNPTLAEEGLTVGVELWLTADAIARAGEPGYLASVLKKDDEGDADNL